MERQGRGRVGEAGTRQGWRGRHEAGLERQARGRPDRHVFRVQGGSWRQQLEGSADAVIDSIEGETEAGGRLFTSGGKAIRSMAPCVNECAVSIIVCVCC